MQWQTKTNGTIGETIYYAPLEGGAIFSTSQGYHKKYAIFRHGLVPLIIPFMLNHDEK